MAAHQLALCSRKADIDEAVRVVFVMPVYINF
jgi:hypothetical protein